MMERRFGFRDIRPLESDAGQERFGLIDLAGGGQAAVLALAARTGSPPPVEALPALWDRLADALPECPVQFTLSRRPVEPARLLIPWRAGIEARLGESAPAGRVWRDLRDSYLPRLQAAGLADLWTGVAVGASDAEQLAGRVARLFTTLPYGVAPLTAGELGGLMGRMLRPTEPAGAGRPLALGGGRMFELPGLAPRVLLIGTTAVSLAPGSLTCYWQISPPLPRVEGGPFRRLLEFPDLLPYAYDLAVHLRPAAAEETMRAVLDGRLAHLEAELGRRGGPPRDAPPLAASPEAADTWLLELERREVVERRAALSGGRERLREAVVLVALHLPVEAPEGNRAGHAPAADARADAFAAALRAAGLNIRPLHGRAALGRAVRATVPLAVADGLRGFAVPARQAAELAGLAATRPAAEGSPVLGLTPEKTALTYAPGARHADHRILAGGAAAIRRATARQWALQSYLDGTDLLIWDPDGAWLHWVEALGGRYARPGGPLPADRLNLLAAPLALLDRPEFFDAWVREIAALFGLLLPAPPGQDEDATRSQVSAALLQLAMRSLEQADPAVLNLEALHTELRGGGYAGVADGLEQLAAGPAGRLFSTPVFAGEAPALVALGPPDGLPDRPARLAARIALRHALWPDTAVLGPPRPPGRQRAVLVDHVSEALKHALLAADLLALVHRPAAQTALWLLPTDSELDPLLAHRVGQALVRPLDCYALFPPAAGATSGAPLGVLPPGLDTLLAAARVPRSLAVQLPLLPPDRALVTLGGQSWVLELVAGELGRDE